jgi:hypothetical protein
MTRKLAPLAALAVSAALIPASSAGASAGITQSLTASTAQAPTAAASGEELISYVTTGKLKVREDIVFQVVCSVDCQINSELELIVPGPNVDLGTQSAPFPAFAIVDVSVELNGKSRKAIREDIKKVKVRSTITGTNLLTGEVDVDSNTFKLKK